MLESGEFLMSLFEQNICWAQACSVRFSEGENIVEWGLIQEASRDSINCHIWITYYNTGERSLKRG